jgi:NAD+ kinase
MIVADPRNEKARRYGEALGARLAGAALPPSLRIVVGGDGYLLRVIAEHGLDCVFLGLNAGHLGFLLNDVDGDWDALARRIAGRQYREYRFPQLRAEILRRNGDRLADAAVNDVYLERSSGQTAHLAVSIDGTVLEKRLAADGLIFSTALGSTAYSFSAGGSPVHPELPVLLVTPICPHRPRLPPVILPAGAIAEVEVITPARRSVRAVADGRAVEEVAHVRISLSDPVVRLAYLQPHDFTRHLVRKILQP